MVELGAAQPGPMAEQITGATPGTGEKNSRARGTRVQTFFSRRETEENKSWSGFGSLGEEMQSERKEEDFDENIYIATGRQVRSVTLSCTEISSTETGCLCSKTSQ